MKTSKQSVWTVSFKAQRTLVQLVFVEMYFSTQASLDMAQIANY